MEAGNARKAFARAISCGSWAVKLGLAEPIESFTAYGRKWKAGMRRKNGNLTFIKRGKFIEFCTYRFDKKIIGGIGASLWYPFALVDKSSNLEIMPYFVEI